MLDSRMINTLMDYHVKLDANMRELFADVGQYRRLVGKLIYLIVTRPNITYAVGVVSQFIHAPRHPHWEAISHILRYLKDGTWKWFVV